MQRKTFKRFKVYNLVRSTYLCCMLHISELLELLEKKQIFKLYIMLESTSKAALIFPNSIFFNAFFIKILSIKRMLNVAEF